MLGVILLILSALVVQTLRPRPASLNTKPYHPSPESYRAASASFDLRHRTDAESPTRIPCDSTNANGLGFRVQDRNPKAPGFAVETQTGSWTSELQEDGKPHFALCR